MYNKKGATYRVRGGLIGMRHGALVEDCHPPLRAVARASSPLSTTLV
jgi:hypothetical protein